MSDHPFGWLSLLPPIVAIAMAIVTRRVILSLLAGIFVGALILAGGNPIAAVGGALDQHLWTTLVNEDKLHVFAFTLLMGAMVGIISANGGMRGLVDVVARWASNRKRGQLTTWLLGLFVFFDDYANTVLLGNTLRPLSDRLKISREKLAYLVDSTAAPVAGLALISTWVAGEIGYVQDGINGISEAIDATPFDVFVRSIPYRFYVIWALLFVPIVAWLGRDFGPMLKAERASLLAPSRNDDSGLGPPRVSHWLNAVIPIAVTVLSVVWFLYLSGKSAFSETETPELREIFGQADSYSSLLWGALAGVLAAALLTVAQRLLTREDLAAGARDGALLMVPALAILWLASTMSAMTQNDPLPSDKQSELIAEAKGETEVAAQTELDRFPYRAYRLYTGAYLSGLLRGTLPAWLLPTIVFVLAAGISFATGTSWGTMGIVMPMAIPLAYAVLSGNGSSVSMADPILLATIGSVLAGAIFGDHCSPISDTTVLSSQASGCDHVAHVRTQLPYALLVGGASILFGTLPIGLGAPVWLMLPVGLVVLFVVLLLVGKRVEE